MRTIAVIPALNEQKHIARVVRKTKQYGDHVIVVDGGSTDLTVAEAAGSGAEILYSNKGYGRQIKGGLLYARELGADIVVMLDGDGQHNPRDIPVMLKLLNDGKADVVMGCRVGNMPKYRRFGNRILTWLCNAGANFKPYDALTGYWALYADKIPYLTEKHWGIAIELLVKSRSDSCRMAAVNVDSIYHDDYADNSSSSPLKLGLNLLWYILKWRLKCEVLR